MAQLYTLDQIRLITSLAFIYYASGDVNDIWNDEDGEELNYGENPNFDYSKTSSIAGEIARAWDIKTEQEILDVLDKIENLYEDHTNFTLMLQFT
jgi:hypothetical protein